MFSGSSGNSIYIESDGYGILIDAGRSAKQIQNAMSASNIDISRLKSIFVTHEHSDHIRGVRVLAGRYNIPVYSSLGTIKAMEELGAVDSKVNCCVIDSKGIDVAGMRVKPFRTSHDSRESIGYCVITSDDKKIVVATDTGFISDEVRSQFCGADIAVIEANHDVNMLKSGRYPYFLKRRILSDTGHLSNEDCARELPQLVKSGVRRFILAHLSAENNIPQLALQTCISSLEMSDMKRGRDFEISVAPRENFSCEPMII